MSRKGKIYSVEDIIGERIKGSQIQYRVRWTGYSSKYDTWEPTASLINCTDIIARFEEKQKMEPRPPSPGRRVRTSIRKSVSEPSKSPGRGRPRSKSPARGPKSQPQKVGRKKKLPPVPKDIFSPLQTRHQRRETLMFMQPPIEQEPVKSLSLSGEPIIETETLSSVKKQTKKKITQSVEHKVTAVQYKGPSKVATEFSDTEDEMMKVRSRKSAGVTNRVKSSLARTPQLVGKAKKMFETPASMLRNLTTSATPSEGRSLRPRQATTTRLAAAGGEKRINFIFPTLRLIPVVAVCAIILYLITNSLYLSRREGFHLPSLPALPKQYLTRLSSYIYYPDWEGFMSYIEKMGVVPSSHSSTPSPPIPSQTNKI